MLTMQSDFPIADVLDGICPGGQVSTVEGPVSVENLTRGMLLCGRDNGKQPLLDLLPLTSSAAKVRIMEGVLGCTRECQLGASQPVLLRHMLIGALFGDAEVIVKAGDLCNGNQVIPANGQLSYRLVLPKPALIKVNGLWLAAQGADGSELSIRSLNTREARVVGECGIFVRRPGERIATRRLPEEQLS